MKDVEVVPSDAVLLEWDDVLVDEEPFDILDGNLLSSNMVSQIQMQK